MDNEVNIGEDRLLKNGGVVLLRKKSHRPDFDYVLALYEDQFVVWVYWHENGSCTSGGYHRDNLAQALNDFNSL